LHPHNPRNQRFRFNGSLARRSLGEVGNGFNPSSISRGQSKFPHNLGPVSVLYSSERPEMSSHDENSKKAKTTEGNKTYENKDN
jgi:hypothetical protein